MLAALALLAAAQAVPGADASPSMVVRADQFASALAVCGERIAQARLDLAAPTGGVWPKVANNQPDATGPAMVMYRHPDNMLLLALIDFPDKPDVCAVMAPVGSELDVARAAAAVAALPGVRGGNGRWTGPAADIRLETMGDAGVRVEFTRKAP